MAIESFDVRPAAVDDLDDIRRIYNEGIEDRVATLDVAPKSAADIEGWWAEHEARFPVVVAADAVGRALAWASLNAFSHRCAHAAIADVSVYVSRAHRGRGIGAALLRALEPIARRRGFHKLVLHALDSNEAGKRLYDRCGFVRVGVFKDHGAVDGKYVDVIAMEKILRC